MKCEAKHLLLFVFKICYWENPIKWSQCSAILLWRTAWRRWEQNYTSWLCEQLLTRQNYNELNILLLSWQSWLCESWSHSSINSSLTKTMKQFQQIPNADLWESFKKEHEDNEIFWLVPKVMLICGRSGWKKATLNHHRVLVAGCHSR